MDLRYGYRRRRSSAQSVSSTKEPLPCKTPTTPLGKLCLFTKDENHKGRREHDVSGSSSQESDLECDSGCSSINSSFESNSSYPSSLNNLSECDSGASSLNSEYEGMVGEGEDTTDTCINYPSHNKIRQEESSEREPRPLLGSIKRLYYRNGLSASSRIKPRKQRLQLDDNQISVYRDGQCLKRVVPKRIASSSENGNKYSDVQYKNRKQISEQLTADQSKVMMESRTSEIFMKTWTGAKSAGFCIRTVGSSHLITNVTSLLFPDMELRDNDEIVAIQNVRVVNWDHSVLTEFLQYLLDPEINSLTLTIKRDENLVDIRMDFTEMDFMTGVKEVLVNIHRTIRYATKSFKKVRMVKYEGTCTCTIRHRISESDFLYFKADGDKLTLDHCTQDDNEKLYHFKRHYFCGQQRFSGQIHGVLFCVFESAICNKVLFLEGFTKIGLMDQPVDKGIQFLKDPDPRFFRTDRRGTSQTIESLVYPELFVSYRDRKLTVTRDDSNEDVNFEINDIQQLPSHVYS